MRNNHGKGLVELICVAGLILLFGLSAYALVAVGGESYDRLLDRRDQNGQMRVGLSYLGMRIRQNDTSGNISIAAVGDGDALLIAHPEYEYDTYIYLNDGVLCEQDVPAGYQPDPYAGEEITPAEGFSAEPVVFGEHSAYKLSLTVNGQTSGVTIMVKSVNK